MKTDTTVDGAMVNKTVRARRRKIIGSISHQPRSQFRRRKSFLLGVEGDINRRRSPRLQSWLRRLDFGSWWRRSGSGLWRQKIAPDID